MLSIKALLCNGKCANCYERRIREIRGGDIKPDIDKILKAIADLPKPKDKNCDNIPHIHGGEPLLFSNDELEKIFSAIFDKYGRNGIQSNGLLIDNKKIELFKKYKVSVGISIDGDTPALNWGRWDLPGTTDGQAKAGTETVLTNIKWLLDNKISVHLMTTLWKYNASKNTIDKLINFVKKMNSWGIRFHRFHAGTGYELPEAELTAGEFGLALYILAENCFASPDYRWSPFREIIDLMLGMESSICTFNGCDPWHTTSEEPLFEDGSRGNCLRAAAAVDGIACLAADKRFDSRSIILPKLSQENGGCAKCEWWAICRGGCPGTAIGEDWRLRTRFCEGWKTLFQYLDTKLRGLFPNIILAQDYGSRPGIPHLLKSISGSSFYENRKVSLETLMAEKGDKKDDGIVYIEGHGDSDDPAWRAANPEWVKKHGTPQRP